MNDKKKLKSLLLFLKDWNFDIELKEEKKVAQKAAAKKKKGIVLATGIWKNHSTSAEQLRKQAWPNRY